MTVLLSDRIIRIMVVNTKMMLNTKMTMLVMIMDSGISYYTPPQNVTKQSTGLLQPNFKEGTGSFVSGGPRENPSNPQNGTQLFNTRL